MSHLRACVLILTIMPSLAWAQLSSYTFYRLGPPGVHVLAPLSHPAIGSVTFPERTHANASGATVSTRQQPGTEATGPIARAVLTSATGAQTLLEPLPGDATSYAGSLNDAGVVAGISGVLNPPEGEPVRSTLVIWVGGQPIDVLTLAMNPGGWSRFSAVQGISEVGHIVGVAEFEGQRRTFLAVASPPPPAPGSPEDKELRGRGRDRHQPRVPPQNPREHPVGR